MRTTIEQEIATSAVTALENATGIVGHFLPGPPSRAPNQDGRVRLSRSGRTAEFHAEVKGPLRRDYLPALIQTLLGMPQPSILVTRYASEPVARVLAEHGVNFLDAAGNAHIEHEGWFVHIVGLPPPRSETPKPLSASVWKVAFALLANPTLSERPIRLLGESAGVSPGAASKAIQALAERGWVENRGRRRVLLRPAGLWMAWETGWLDRLASDLFVTHAVAPMHDGVQAWSRWWPNPADGNVLIGGELGAQCLGAGIVAETATLHVEQWNAALLGRLRLVPAKRGPFTIRRTFGSLNTCRDMPEVAHPMLVRAELLPILDERLDEPREVLAQRIRSDLPHAP